MVKVILLVIRKKSTWNSLLHISLEVLILEIGYDCHCLSGGPPDHLITKTCLIHMWDNLASTSCILEFKDMYQFKHQWEHDSFIMKNYDSKLWKRKELRYVNF